MFISIYSIQGFSFISIRLGVIILFQELIFILLFLEFYSYLIFKNLLDIFAFFREFTFIYLFYTMIRDIYYIFSSSFYAIFAVSFLINA